MKDGPASKTIFCLQGFIESVLTQPTGEREEKSDRCGFPSMKTICNFGFNKKIYPDRQRGIHFVGGHKHTDRVCEGKATQLCQSCDIFVEF